MGGATSQDGKVVRDLFASVSFEDRAKVRKAAQVVSDELNAELVGKSGKVHVLRSHVPAFTEDDTLDAVAGMYLSIQTLTSAERRTLIDRLRTVQAWAKEDLGFSVVVSLAALPEGAQTALLENGKALPDLLYGLDCEIAQIVQKGKRGHHEAARHLAAMFDQVGLKVSRQKRSRFVQTLGAVFQLWGINDDPVNAATAVVRSRR